jgi:wobble nucleotide-excising tRNase
MITRILRVKNLRIFDAFSWDAALHPFKQYNVCYGYNGSGKTTLTRLFAVS